jgi:hypothetical protein
MGDLVPLYITKRTIRKLARSETELLHELYHISAGGQDPVPTIDPEVEYMVRVGIIEMPWSYWYDGF